jgi:hypothetical protein
MEPDLPALTEAEELERCGQQRLPMPEEPALLDDEGPSDDLPTPRRYDVTVPFLSPTA